jgi:glycosyltransferase involved in cell wall biosynthesis
VHIVLSVDALTPPLSGIGRYTWELATRLPAVQGIRVRFYREGKWISDLALLLNTAQPHIRRTWLQRQEPRWLREARLTWDCRGEVFHGPNFFLPACANIGVATIHDLSVFKYPETHPIERIRQYEREFDSTISRALHLIAVSEFMRQEIIAFLGWPADRITTVPNGVSGLFRPRVAAETADVMQGFNLKHGSYTLCVSTIEPRKKIDRLLSAYSRLPTALRARYPLLLLGGKGWKSEDIHKQIERFCAEGWLRYQGFVPESDLPALYAGASLFVYPSIYEGFGLPVLEAMASGVPVITSNCSSLPEVTGGAACLVEPDDEDALLDAIRMGLDDDIWKAQAVKAGLQVARRFTWDRCVEETVAVYRKVIG